MASHSALLLFAALCILPFILSVRTGEKQFRQKRDVPTAPWCPEATTPATPGGGGGGATTGACTANFSCPAIVTVNNVVPEITPLIKIYVNQLLDNLRVIVKCLVVGLKLSPDVERTLNGLLTLLQNVVTILISVLIALLGSASPGGITGNGLNTLLASLLGSTGLNLPTLLASLGLGTGDAKINLITPNGLGGLLSGLGTTLGGLLKNLLGGLLGVNLNGSVNVGGGGTVGVGGTVGGSVDPSVLLKAFLGGLGIGGSSGGGTTGLVQQLLNALGLGGGGGGGGLLAGILG